LEIGLSGRWGRSNGKARTGGVREKKKARTGANSSGALAIETSGLDSNPMEGLLSSVLGILNGTFGSLAGNYLTLSSKGAK
jgi:hypothetical protein